ncbi:3285_t:CDS:2, partial [Gigaspora rosea]
VTTRYKYAVALTSKTSSEVWNAIEKIYNDPKNPFKWPALLMVDSAGEFKGSFAKGMEQYNVPIRVVNLYSFESLALVKKFKQDLARLIYKIQYAIEHDAIICNVIGEVIPKVSTKPKRPIGKDKPRLQKGLTVRYLLKSGELEGGHMHRKTDLWWSLRIYKIKKVIVGKNPPQPVLYYLEDEPIDSTKHLIGLDYSLAIRLGWDTPLKLDK